jgi:hypothetical protein
MGARSLIEVDDILLAVHRGHDTVPAIARFFQCSVMLVRDRLEAAYFSDLVIRSDSGKRGAPRVYHLTEAGKARIQEI